MKYGLTILFMICAIQLSAQKRLLLEDQTKIIERAQANIEAAFEDVDTQLYETHMSYPYVGRYVFKITIGNKFRVTSVFVEERDGGSIHLDGKEIDIRSPGDAINARICLLTEDRKHQGLVLMHSVRENFGLPNLAEFSHLGVIDHASERNAFQKYVETIGIKISDMEQIAGNLSGGNQQKIVIAKWLQHNCEIIIFDEPTRGIDVGAKYEIYMLMNQLAAAGKAIIMISSELPEVIGMSDRIIVMRNGEISGEVTDVANTTQEELLDLAIH